MVVHFLFLQLKQDYGSQILGIIGTILGTVIGWLLHLISDNVAKTYIDIESFNEEKNENNEYACILKLFIFNDSRKQQCIRNLRLSFIDKKGKVSLESYLSEGRCIFQTIRSHNENTVPVMISINSYAQSEYFFSDLICDREFTKLLQAQKIYLLYEDRKNNTKKISVISKFRLENVPQSEYARF